MEGPGSGPRFLWAQPLGVIQMFPGQPAEALCSGVSGSTGEPIDPWEGQFHTQEGPGEAEGGSSVSQVHSLMDYSGLILAAPVA